MAANYDPLATKPTGDRVDGQHWETVRELWMKKDKEQCENWKDEVQNVLIFAGLFSAIVTAFLIESHKNLLPDPAQESVQLLRQIAAQSAGKSCVTEAEREIDPISIYVNVFWFLSLVFSLTAALVGIVSLQWIRSHMRGLSSGAESLGLSYMHSLGLRQSYIPLVFTSLPVILIFGLTFFLIGLILFLVQLSWPVAIPVTFAIACTIAFLVVTTVHPALQSLPVSRPSNEPSNEPNFYPSPYRSSQSILFFQCLTLVKRWWPSQRGVQTGDNSHGRGDWMRRSQIWFEQRKKDFLAIEKELSHLESKWEGVKVDPFAYDVIQALISVKESRSAESEREKTALAKCLAEVLPIHLKLFPTRDLADLIPFLPPSKSVPSALFLRGNSATVEDLSAVALLQAATSKGRPLQSAALAQACVVATRWLFEQPRTFDSVPDSQPLSLISKPEELSPDVLEVLISTLARFFAFAANYRPESQCINKTTHTSSYTYWFLVLSAKILSKCSLSEEMQSRHAYIVDMNTLHLRDGAERYYLFLTASIYASIISTSPVVRSAEDGRRLLDAVKYYRDAPKDDVNRQQLRKALMMQEVQLHRAPEPTDGISVFDPTANVMTGSRRLGHADDQDATLGEAVESVGRLGDGVNSSGSGRSPSRGCIHTYPLLSAQLDEFRSNMYAMELVTENRTQGNIGRSELGIRGPSESITPSRTKRSLPNSGSRFVCSASETTSA